MKKRRNWEIVDFRSSREDSLSWSKNTKRYSSVGLQTGKTYLARAVAGEAGVPFYHKRF